MLKQARYLFGTYDDVAQAISDKNGILEKNYEAKSSNSFVARATL